MSQKRYTLVILAAVALAASILACNPPETPGPKPAPDTVTPYVPATTQPEVQPTEPPKAPTEETAPTEEAAPTETPTPSSPTPTSTLTATKTSAPPVSEGPLDFEEPRWVHAWESDGSGGVLVTVKIKIIGGAPPFTVKHEGDVIGNTTNREFLFEFSWVGCQGIARNITVESADGQSKSKNYWLSRDVMGWCE
jgi:hypothetical protein